MLVRDDGLHGSSVIGLPPLVRQSLMNPRHAGLRRIRAVVLLGGSVNPTSLRSAVRRSLLDLPIERWLSLSQLWCEQANSLLSTLPGSQLTVRFMLDRRSPQPAMVLGDSALKVHVERDPQEWRGTGGVLRDVAHQYDPDDRILVAGAAQVLLKPLPELMQMLAAPKADVALASHSDGTPVTLMLVRCGCLRQIPEIGFADMKEQGLPAIAKKCKVSVIQQDDHVAMPIRTFHDYISALRQYHTHDASLAVDEAFQERWHPSFSIVERGAVVSRDARIHDSVVLRGARVESGSVIVRSLVCPGAHVRRKQVIVDQLVLPE